MAKNQEFAKEWTSDQLISVAKWQRYAIRILFLQILGVIAIIIQIRMPIPSFSRGIPITDPSIILQFSILIFLYITYVLSVYSMYHLAKSLKKRAPVLYGLAGIIQKVNLMVLAILTYQAINILEANGMKVGLLGVDKEEIVQFVSESKSKK